MLDDEELLLGTNFSNQNTSVCAWNYNTGNIQHVYKSGGISLIKSLCTLDNDYILTAEQDKPLLHIWQVNSQEQLKNVRFVMPDVVNCLDINFSNNYAVAGIGLKIYLWHINSGRLINILQKHYQPITNVKFSSDSAYLIICGKDGMLVVYKLDDVACSTNSSTLQKTIGECEPVYTKMDHSSEITDLAVGNFGRKSRIATISNDLTCRIYNLQTGDLLLTLVFNEIPTSALFDSTCWNIYFGDIKGSIKRIHLKDPPRTLEYHVQKTLSDNFNGHQKKVTCLSLNLTNDILASGSEDFNIIIWETSSRNILRKMERSGIITNLKFVINHANFRAQTLRSNVVFQPLQRNIDTNMKNYVVYGNPRKISFEDEELEKESENINSETLNNPQSQINDLKIINKQIYDAFIKIVKRYNGNN